MGIEPGVEIVTKKLVLNHYHGSLSPDERTFLDQLFEHKMRVGGFFIGLDKPQIHVFEPRILFEKEMEKRGVEVFRCLTEADHYVDIISKIKSDNKAERGFSIETYLQAKKMKIPCTIMVDRLQTSTLDSFGRGISGFESADVVKYDLMNQRTGTMIDQIKVDVYYCFAGAYRNRSINDLVKNGNLAARKR